MNRSLFLSFLGVFFAIFLTFGASTAKADDGAAVSGGESFAALVADNDGVETDQTLIDDHHCHRRCEQRFHSCTSGCGPGHHGHDCRRACRHQYDHCIRHCHHH